MVGEYEKLYDMGMVRVMTGRTAAVCMAVCAAVCEAAGQPAVIRVNDAVKHQTIDNFGASDAWTMRFLGEASAETVRQTADWLFSTECDAAGQPLGIGLSIWRFNLTAGSAEQGDASRINAFTRGESFFAEDGSYDWDKLRGQRRMLREARARGVEHFLMFLNSPDVRFTQNGLATNTGRGDTYNLKPECADEWASYMADVIEGIARHDSVRFDYVSPFNEPDGHWNWIGPKQEGTPATKHEIAALTRRLGEEFSRRGLKTRIVIPESSDYRCLVGTYMTDSRRGYGIQSFFTRDSVDTYVGDVPNVPRMVAGHTYWTTTPLTMLRDMRVALRDTLRSRGVDFWQTEYCIMGNDEEIGGGGYDFTMRTALYVARIIHHDLVFADARAWQWWRAVGEDYKDGLLREFHDEGDAPSEWRVRDSKLLWTVGNFARFIRPGARRVEVECDGLEEATDPTGLMVSAYENADGSRVVVIINYAEMPSEVSPDWGGRTCWRAYRTSDAEGENLKPVGETRGREKVVIPARSVVTLVGAPR